MWPPFRRRRVEGQRFVFRFLVRLCWRLGLGGYALRFLKYSQIVATEDLRNVFV